MKTIAAATLFATVALAQTSLRTIFQNSLIPTGISTSCSTFLTKFNSDTSLTSCTSALITATGAFAPSTNATASTSASAAQVKTALTSVCAATTCPDSTIRSKLADFYEACSDELKSANKDVVTTYDVLYALTPLKNAICAKDDSNNYCVNSIASTTSQSSGVLSTIAKYVSLPMSASSAVSRRADAAQVVASIAPNATTFADNNLLFLMLQPDLSSDKLCQTCTRNILTSYISFESSSPYAPGLASSVLLAGQSKLYQAITDTCGSNFLNGGVAAAAGLSGGVLGGSDNGASQTLANSGIATTLVGALALILNAAL
ncbi:hypothetical protein C8Q80DRAFT_1108576 [Daedaleopsis nitida]|nr:hypothetical protein C8Q80DRAFT_1108576 [Daedaleopsis nitida]